MEIAISLNMTLDALQISPQFPFPKRLRTSLVILFINFQSSNARKAHRVRYLSLNTVENVTISAI